MGQSEAIVWHKDTFLEIACRHGVSGGRVFEYVIRGEGSDIDLLVKAEEPTGVHADLRTRLCWPPRSCDDVERNARPLR